ncbi:MAG: hypothetical protein IJ232_01820 [Lachnospiraceae bacterium]|nr:hypothetical protein [Lachnospiraceae bacterium]
MQWELMEVTNLVTICSLRNVAVKNSNGILGKRINMEIHNGDIIGLISENAAADRIMQAICGFYKPRAGRIWYSHSLRHGKGKPSKIQYVPDDIICYRDLTVEEFLVAASITAGEAAAKEQTRLCSQFGINIKKKLLEISYEQNRLVAYILAMSLQPDILLINRPTSLLSNNAFLMVCKELVELHNKGTAIIMAESSFENLKFPCGNYHFIASDEIRSYTRKSLPKPGKVVSLVGGTIHPEDMERCRILYGSRRLTKFVCHEQDRNNLIVMIYRTGCRDFSVENLTMKEEIYQDYSRWIG